MGAGIATKAVTRPAPPVAVAVAQASKKWAAAKPLERRPRSGRRSRLLPTAEDAAPPPPTIWDAAAVSEGEDLGQTPPPSKPFTEESH